MKRIRSALIEEWKHLAVHNAATSGEPLHVALAESGRCSQRVRVVAPSPPHIGDRFEAPVWVLREAGHGRSVVHVPTIDARKVAADLSAR